MRLKVFLLVIFAAILSFSLLSSNSVSETAEKIVSDIKLVTAEIPEIISVINAGNGRSDSTGADMAVPDRQDSPIRLNYHTEVFESIYNSANKRSTLASLGEYAYRLSEAYPATEASGRIRVELPAVMNADTLLDAIRSEGIEADVEYVSNPAPEGDVVALYYSGFSGDAIYFDPGTSVKLIASAKKPAEQMERSGRLVYITFDDGPTKNGTCKVLDVLDEFGIKATFFTLGASIDLYPDSAKAITERGHNLGCHSYSHVYSDIYNSSWAMGQEIERWENAVKSAGIETGGVHLFRFPGGSVNSYMNEYLRREMIGMVEGRGYRIFDWNVVTNDAVLYTAPEGVGNYEFIKDTFEETLQSCLSAYGDNEPIIVLMHETVGETQNQLRWVLEYFIDRGYSFGDLRDIDSWVFK